MTTEPIIQIQSIDVEDVARALAANRGEPARRIRRTRRYSGWRARLASWLR